MSETVISILVWLHVIGVAIWLGGQIVTAACVIPALRDVGDRTLWLDALEGFTRRFGRVGIVAMVVIVITGGAMIDPRLDQIELTTSSGDLYAARWGYIFVIKMALWAVMIALIGLHQFVFGPRQLELARESAEADEDTPELQRVRRITIALSISGLLMTLLVAGAGAFLGNHNFSMLPS